MTASVSDVARWIEAFESTVAENREYLTQLDSAIGDADHGTNMHRGMKAARAKIDGHQSDDVGKLLKTVGMALVSTVGGAGGPLYGTLFMQMGSALSGRAEFEIADWAAALDAGVKGVQARGKAGVGDKTMIDALAPARDALIKSQENGLGMAEGLDAAVDAAEEGMKSTIPLVARKGRASYLGERSAGHQDPGATSSYLLMRSAAETLRGSGHTDEEEVAN